MVCMTDNKTYYMCILVCIILYMVCMTDNKLIICVF